MEKTPPERRRYIENVVRGSDASPTIPTPISEQGSATDSPQREEQQAARRPSRRRTARDPGWWERNRDEVKKFGLPIVGTLAAAGLIALAGFFIYDLNRDVAQLKQRAESTTQRLNDMQQNANRVEDRLMSEIRYLRDRLEDVRDRVLGRPPRQTK